MLHNPHSKDIHTSKTETWFKETGTDSIEQKNKQKSKQENNMSTPKKTNPTNKVIKNSSSNNFRHKLTNHRDDFVRIITTSNQHLDSLQGILARIEGNFITLINTPTVIKIPITKITAIIIQPNKITASNLSPQEIKPTIKQVIEALLDLIT